MWVSFSNQSLFLAPNQVHVWSVNKPNHTDRLSNYWSILNEVERERASKYRFDNDRDCFVIARGVLRKLLGNYLNMSPEAINFKFGKYGKPFLIASNGIEFNVSHSGDTIVLGFIKDDIIGVDVEFTKRKIEINKIVEHFFSDEEIAALFSLDKSYHTQAFYNCWTRKEAFIKALGSGLSFPLDQFVVSLDSAKEALLLDTKWDAKEKKNWVLKSFEPAENYIGAVSVKGLVTDLKYWRYQ